VVGGPIGKLVVNLDPLPPTTYATIPLRHAARGWHRCESRTGVLSMASYLGADGICEQVKVAALDAETIIIEAPKYQPLLYLGS
jgi:hypothetical protein